MKGFIKYKKYILIIVGLVLFLHSELFANSIYSEELYVKSAYSSESINSPTATPTTVNNSTNIEVKLNSFGTISMMIMLILTSLLGAFFVQNEFSDVLD